MASDAVALVISPQRPSLVLGNTSGACSAGGSTTRGACEAQDPPGAFTYAEKFWRLTIDKVVAPLSDTFALDTFRHL